MKRSTKEQNTDLFRVLVSPKRARQAWEEIYLLYRKPLVRFLQNKLTGRDTASAEDLVDDVFIKMWIKRKLVAPMERPRDWLYSVANNDMLDHLKTRQRRKCELLDDHLEVADGYRVDEDMDGRELSQRVRAAMSRLPPETQKVLLMKFGDGKGNSEIAKKQGKSAQTVGNQVQQGIRKLKQWMNAKGSQPK